MNKADELKRLCAQFAEHYGFPADDYPRGLEGFTANLFVREPGFTELCEGEHPDEAHLEEYICRTNDGGADVILRNFDQKIIIIAQCAYESKKQTQLVDKLKAFLPFVNLATQPNYFDSKSAQVGELLGSLKNDLNDGWGVELRFVTNRPLGNDDSLQLLVDAQNVAYEAQGVAVSCEIFGQADLLSHLESLGSEFRGAAVPSVTFKIQKDRMLVLGEDQMPYPSLVGLIKAREIVRVHNERGVKNALFNLNIRLPLYRTAINPEIKRTAVEDPQDFVYFNNGISAVCSEFEVQGTEVTAKRIQVVNGAQTLHSLVKANELQLLPEDIYVLLRLTATGETTGGQLTDGIIRFNNTQNPVKSSDFFSNEPIHSWLASQFKTTAGKGAIPKFSYLYKQGTKATSGHVSITMQELAKIRHSFIYGPYDSYKQPKQFFLRAPDGKYEEAFGVDGKEVSSWTDEELNETAVAVALTLRVQREAHALKKMQRSSSEPTKASKYLYRLARYSGSLVGFGLREQRATNGPSFKELAQNMDLFNQRVEPLLKHALLLIDIAVSPRYKTNQQPEYGFATNSKDWEDIQGMFLEHLRNGSI
jgi:hypothetical protein